MKKVIVIVLCIMIVIATAGCALDNSNPENSQPENLTSSIVPTMVYNYIYNDDEYCTYNMTLQALDESGTVIWEYTTPKSFVGQCESLEYLGISNGLVYINESGLPDFDNVTENGFANVNSHLLALNASDGSVAWYNTDYTGTGTSVTFDDEGNIYLAGYFGPDCIKIDKNGKTVWWIPSVDPDLYWAYELCLENNTVKITFEMNENGEEETVVLSTETGEVLNA